MEFKFKFIDFEFFVFFIVLDFKGIRKFFYYLDFCIGRKERRKKGMEKKIVICLLNWDWYRSCGLGGLM